MTRSPAAQGRRVRLVVRRVEPWTVLKFSVLLFATLYMVVLVAGLVLWAAATATGVRENVEKFIGDLIASDDFKILGATMFRASVLGGLVMVVMGTGAAVLMTVLYNLISDVVGGIIVVFEERPTRRRLRIPRPNQPGHANQPVDGGVAPPPLNPAKGDRRRLTRPVPRPGGPLRPGGPGGVSQPLPPPDRAPVQPETVSPAELMRHQD